MRSLPPRVAPGVRRVLLLGVLTAGCSSSGGAVQQHAPRSERAEPPDAGTTAAPDGGASDAGLAETPDDGGAEVPVGELRAEDVHCGVGHCCAILNDKTVRCWGRNWAGQLGDGTTQDRNRPVIVRLPRQKAVPVQLTGYGNECVRMSDGTAWCWGEDVGGELNNGATESRSTPVQVVGLRDARQIAAGWLLTCATLGDGTARCWGYIPGSNVANGTTTPADGLRDVIEISIGMAHGCARLGDGTAKCWGGNVAGELGVGFKSYGRAMPPWPVVNLKGAVHLAVGGRQSCVVLEDQTVSCWGWNEQCQLGDGTRVHRYQPTPVRGLQNVVQLALDYSSSCARTQEGVVFCWGLVHVPHATKPVHSCYPRPVPGLSSVAQITAGAVICARKTDGGVLCWGQNDRGELGDGTNELRSHPVLVQW